MNTTAAFLDRLAVEVFGDGHFNTAGGGGALYLRRALGGAS